MQWVRIGFLLVVNAVPIVFLLRGGLTPLDVLILSWAEGFVAIAIHRVLSTWDRAMAERRKPDGRSLRWLLKEELGIPLLSGVGLYGLFGAFLWGAVVIMAQGKAVPWSLGAQEFWTAAGWMAAVIGLEAVVTAALLVTRPARAHERLVQRRWGLGLRLLADVVVLFCGASLVARGAGVWAMTVLIVVKTGVDIVGEWLGEHFRRRWKGRDEGASGGAAGMGQDSET